jgi:hypothetical protein
MWRRPVGRARGLIEPPGSIEAHVRVQLAGSHLDGAVQQPALRVRKRCKVAAGKTLEICVGDAEQGDEPVLGRRLGEQQYGVVATQSAPIDRQGGQQSHALWHRVLLTT